MSLQTYFKEFNKVIKMDYDVRTERKKRYFIRYIKK